MQAFMCRHFLSNTICFNLWASMSQIDSAYQTRRSEVSGIIWTTWAPLTRTDITQRTDLLHFASTEMRPPLAESNPRPSGQRPSPVTI